MTFGTSPRAEPGPMTSTRAWRNKRAERMLPIKATVDDSGRMTRRHIFSDVDVWLARCQYAQPATAISFDGFDIENTRRHRIEMECTFPLRFGFDS